MYFRVHRTKYNSIDELQKCIDSTLADTLDKGPWEFKVVIVRWKNRVKTSKAVTYPTVKSLFHVLQTVGDRVTFYEIVPAGTDPEKSCSVFGGTFISLAPTSGSAAPTELFLERVGLLENIEGMFPNTK